VRDRTILLDETNRAHRVLGVVVRSLDWLARCRIAPARTGDPVGLVERDGSTLAGGAAVVRVLSRLPLTAMCALPLTGLARLGLRRRAAAA
jgi:hypothetical protein